MEVTYMNDGQIIQQMTKDASQAIEKGNIVEMESLVAALRSRPKIHIPTSAVTSLRESKRAVETTMTLESVQQAIVVVGGVFKCKRCTRWHVAPASGFLIADDLLVTNYHVMDQPSYVALAVRLWDGRFFTVKEIVAASTVDDLVILRIPSTGVCPLKLANHAAPVGGNVELMSHPKQRFYTLSEGRISRYFMMQKQEGPDNVMIPMMTITADFGRGSSGAPVLDATTREVVGIATRTESVFYSSKNDGQGQKKEKMLQMVLKHCVPVDQLWKLIDGK